MLVLLQGQVLNIMQDKFQSRKTGEWWHTILYQVLTSYQGQKMDMQDLQTMSATPEPPDPELLRAIENRKPVDILIKVSPDNRTEKGISARIVQVSPMAAPLQISANGSGSRQAAVAAAGSEK